MRPDYRGGGILNLMASIVAGRGGEAEYPELERLPGHELAGARNLMLLVVDGLGADWLARRSPDGILARHGIATLTSVFPSTTAAAITTFLTGDPPSVHGLTGWYTYLGELGCVMTVLPGTPRYGGVGYGQAGIDAAALLGHRPLCDRIATDSVLISPARIAHSDFSLAHRGRAAIGTFDDLHGLFRQAAQTIRASSKPKYLYAYWPELDHIGHEHGMESVPAVMHLHEIERALTDFMVCIAGSDTRVLITADHGHIDSSPADQMRIQADDPIGRQLILPLCGEPRAAWCYLRPGREQALRDALAERFGERIEIHLSEAVLEQGWLGPGPYHPRIHDRIGDLCLIPTDSGVLHQYLPHERPFRQIGVHGGLSNAEMRVPLVQLNA